MSTYTKKGFIYSNFNKDRFDVFDDLGRQAATSYFEQLGYQVSVNDKSNDGSIIYKNTDLIAIKGKTTIFIEAETKRSSLMEKFVLPKNKLDAGGSVDLMYRKLNVCKPNTMTCFSMCDYIEESDNIKTRGENLLIIPGELLIKAKDNGYNEGDFPHLIRKTCAKGFKQTGTVEDAIRIPYKYIYHLKLVDGKYIMVHSPKKES